MNFFALINVLFVFGQITLGAFVAGLDGGYIYNSFPLMNDSFIPDEFNSNMPLISYFSSPGIVQFFHRIIAYLIAANCLVFVIKSFRLNILKRTTLLLSIMIFLQIILGAVTLIWQVPLVVASLHQLVAIVVYSISLYIFCVCFKIGKK